MLQSRLRASALGVVLRRSGTQAAEPKIPPRKRSLLLIRCSLLFLVIVAALVGVPPGARSAFAASSPAGSPPEIAAVRFEGAKTVSEVLLHGHVESRPGEVFSLRRVRSDIRSLFSLGEFDQVEAYAEEAGGGKVVLVFRLKERPRVGQIRIEGNERKKDSKIREKITTTVQSPFDPARWTEDLAAVRSLYREDGYTLTKVEGAEILDEEKGVVELVVRVDEGPQLKIEEVRIEGARDFSEKKLKGRFKNMKEGKKYRPDKLPEDLRNLEDFLRNEGYLRASVVSHEVRVDETERKVYLTVRVHEGVPYRLGKVSFEGHSLFEEEDLRRAFRLEEGNLLRQKDLDAGQGAVQTLYADRGYIYADVSAEVTYDEEARTADVAFAVREGEVAYIQDVRIAGNYKTKDYVIRREILTGAGEKFEADKIRKSVQNLYNLGFFEEVNPRVEPGEERGKEVLVYSVKERKTGSIGLGGGYSSVDKLVGNLRFEEANLFGRGQRLLLEWEFGKRRNSYQVSFTEPWLFGTHTSFGFDVFNTTRLLEFWTEKRQGGSLRLGRRLNRRWSIFGNYSYELVQIKDVTGEFADPASPQFIAESRDATSSFTPRVVYDSRDNVFDPSRGWRHQLAVKLAGGPLGADNNFYKVIGDSSRWMKLPLWKFVAGGHVQLGYAEGYRANGRFTDVPLFDRFFLGGSDTVRGYRERKIPPVSGGRVLYVFNGEIKYPLAGPLRGVLFFDAGGLWGDLERIENTLQYGAGVGVRLTIPGTVMAIRLDYGWPVNTDLPEGSAPRGGTLHFNLGDIF